MKLVKTLVKKERQNTRALQARQCEKIPETLISYGLLQNVYNVYVFPHIYTQEMWNRKILRWFYVICVTYDMDIISYRKFLAVVRTICKLRKENIVKFYYYR
jgi:hypothetical protein